MTRSTPNSEYGPYRWSSMPINDHDSLWPPMPDFDHDNTFSIPSYNLPYMHNTSEIWWVFYDFIVDVEPGQRPCWRLKPCFDSTDQSPETRIAEGSPRPQTGEDTLIRMGEYALEGFRRKADLERHYSHIHTDQFPATRVHDESPELADNRKENPPIYYDPDRHHSNNDEQTEEEFIEPWIRELEEREEESYIYRHTEDEDYRRSKRRADGHTSRRFQTSHSSANVLVKQHPSIPFCKRLERSATPSSGNSHAVQSYRTQLMLPEQPEEKEKSGHDETHTS
ncbi:hypothetical protein F5Y03DRAFT_410443 [Xylaria venustula]|nr:hypothetical protein F5Y03DRAFT_410443 [Xylaria venustula]